MINSYLREQLMGRKVLMVIGISALLTALSSCHNAPSLEPTTRPSGVPSTALWAGGADGGAYIECSVNEERNVNHCTVWNDYTGQVAESGDFRLVKENRAATNTELRFRGVAGGVIFLEGNLMLKLQSGAARM
jgi:hypothetical protein